MTPRWSFALLAPFLLRASAIRTSVKITADKALKHSNDEEKFTGGSTSFRFAFPAAAAPEASANEASALADVSIETEAASALSVEEQAKAWEQESAYYSRQTAVQQVWHHTTKVLNYSGTEVAQVVKTIRAGTVPGLGGVTFGQVFVALQRAGCPIWMVGGTVRDLLAGLTPNDVDCVVLCHSNKVRQVARTYGWKNDGGNAQYFSIGDAHGDDPNYLEGFSIDLILSNPFTPEWSVNLLMWSLTYDYIVDPSGKGVSDAQSKILRPGAPPEQYVREHSQWGVWRQWLMNSFAAPKMQRHVRYLKMRSRGWQPADECVRFFMADQVHKAAHLANQNPAGPVANFAGEQEPSSPGGILTHLAEKVGGQEGQEKKQEVVLKLLKPMQEDLQAYFNTSRAAYQGCLYGARAAVIAKEHLPRERSFGDVLEYGLVRTCSQPSQFLETFATSPASQKAHLDFVGACTAILAIFETTYPWKKGAYTVSRWRWARPNTLQLPVQPLQPHFLPTQYFQTFGQYLIPPNQMPQIVTGVWVM